MKTTRQLILDHIKTRQVATAIEISHALELTPANVRHHLSILISEGAITVIGERPPQGRGRPSLLFSASKQASQHNLDQLASALLRELLETSSDTERRSRLERLGRRLAGEHKDSQSSLTNRLYHAVQKLNQLKYQARWEAHSTAPHIILGHCPYAAILAEHPELCELDGKLLEQLLGVPVQQTACLARDKMGMTYCLFTVIRLA